MCHHSHIVTFKITSNFKLLVPYETQVLLSSGVEGNQKIRYLLKKKKKKGKTLFGLGFFLSYYLRPSEESGAAWRQWGAMVHLANIDHELPDEATSLDTMMGSHPSCVNLLV